MIEGNVIYWLHYEHSTYLKLDLDHDSHDWEEDWTDVLLSGGGVRGSGMSGEGEGFSLDKSFADIVYYSLKQAPLFSIIPKA